MARFGVNGQLSNPAYMGGLFEAAKGVGGASGARRNKQVKQDEADRLNEALKSGGTMGMLAAQVAQAKTPEEAAKYQLMLENFRDLETTRANSVEDRKIAATDRARTQKQEQATARLSVLANERKKFQAAGNEEAVNGIDKAMGAIAAEAGVEVGAIETMDNSKRYLNIGGGKVFDSKEGKFITDPSEEQAKGPELAPKDYLKAVSSIQQNNKQWTEKAFQAFLTDIKAEGVYGSAEKHLTSENMVDYDKQAASKSSSSINDAVSKIGLIDELMTLAPDMDPDGSWGNIARGVGQQVFGGVGGTEAKKIETMTKTLQADEAFSALQTMRDNSKTGGALGSISERELDLLMSNTRNLDPSSPDFKEALQAIKAQYQRILDIEMGPEGGSDRYRTGPDGRVFYKDPESGYVYDYATGEPVNRRR